MADIRHKEYFPRRTNLAGAGARTGAFLVDLALFLGLTLILYYGVFRFAFQGAVTPLENQVFTYQVESGLFYSNENGNISIYETENSEDYEVYIEPIQYYYFNYLTGNVAEGRLASPDSNQTVVIDGTDTGILPKDYYTVEWYNTNVLKIGENPLDQYDTGYFTYVTDESGQFIKDQIGVPKESRYDADAAATLTISKADLVSFYGDAYIAAYEDLTYRDYYVSVYNQYLQIQSITLMVPVIVSLCLIYLLFPYIFKDGATVGKLAFKLGLANMDGYRVTKWRIALRPALAIVISLIIFLGLYSVNIYISFMVGFVPFIISWVLTLASPKKCALHDYISQTVVVDMKTSEIFKNSLEEYVFLSKEEGLPIDRNKLASEYSEEAINEAYKKSLEK